MASFKNVAKHFFGDVINKLRVILSSCARDLVELAVEKKEFCADSNHSILISQRKLVHIITAESISRSSEFSTFMEGAV